MIGSGESEPYTMFPVHSKAEEKYFTISIMCKIHIDLFVQWDRLVEGPKPYIIFGIVLLDIHVKEWWVE